MDQGNKSAIVKQVAAELGVPVLNVPMPPADAGHASVTQAPATPASVTKTMDETVANLSQKDAIASRIHGPQLLVALRTIHSMLLALMDQGEFDMGGVEMDLNATTSGGETLNILHLDGEQVMLDNEALLNLIKKDPDDE